MSVNLRRADQRLVRRLCGGPRRHVRERQPLRALHADTDPDRHRDPDCHRNPDRHRDSDGHTNADRDPDANADPHPDPNQHGWSERLLSVS